MISEVRARYGTFPIFFVVGVFCTLLDFVVLYLLTDILGIWYLLSGVISFTLVSIIGFLTHKKFSFADTSKQYHRQYVKFYLVIVIGAIMNNGLLFIFTNELGLWYMLSRAIAVVITMLWNYFGYSRIVFI